MQNAEKVQRKTKTNENQAVWCLRNQGEWMQQNCNCRNEEFITTAPGLSNSITAAGQKEGRETTSFSQHTR